MFVYDNDLTCDVTMKNTKKKKTQYAETNHAAVMTAEGVS